MPRLQVLAVCRHVIISQEENVPSLISIIDGFIIEAPKGKLPDPSILIPAPWEIFTSWKLEPTDEGKKYEQITRVRLPDGQYAGDMLHPLEFPPPRRSVRITIAMEGFPARPGTYTIEVGFREAGSSEATLVKDYTIDMTHREVS